MVFPTYSEIKRFRTQVVSESNDFTGRDIVGLIAVRLWDIMTYILGVRWTLPKCHIIKLELFLWYDQRIATVHVR